MRRLVPVLLVLLLVSWFVAAQQAKTQGHPTSARASGKTLFQQSCASCHGDDGKGAELLRLLEAEQIVPRSGRASPVPTDATDNQLALFGMMTHSVVQQLRNVDPNAMTPIQALEMLARLVDEVKREGGST